LATLVGSAFGGDITVTASVDKTVVPLNEAFTLSIEVSGEGAQSIGEPKLPNLDTFAAFVSSGSSTSIQFINGRMSMTKVFSYTFLPRQVGKFQIGPAEVQYQGKSYTTTPISIEITQAAAKPAPRPGQPRAPSVETEQSIAGNLFIKAVPNKRRVYQNEPVVITYKIYTRVNVSSYAITKLPNTAGFWAEEFPLSQPPVTHEEVLDGRKFVVAEIRKVALFPTNPGRKTVEPLEVDCEVRLRTRRSSRDFFDSFFEDPFFARTVRYPVRSEPVTVEVMPLPEAGKPAHFSGAVGRFTLSAQVDKDSVRTNEAVTLKVKVAGQGNIKIISEPLVAIPPDFEKYAPKVTENIDKKNDTVSGSKTFEYVLVPRFAGLQRLRSVEFTYFDPASGAYRVLKTPEITIQVSKGAEELVAAVTAGVSKEEVKLLGQDIRFIKMTSPLFRRRTQSFYESRLFVAAFLIPLVILGGAIGYRRHLDRLSANVAYARSRKATQTAMKRLGKAKKLLAVETQKAFYAEVSHALLGFLADKLNLSHAGLLTEQVEELLGNRGVNGEVVSNYLRCLQVCDFQRFAAAQSDSEEMKRVYHQAREAIAELEKAL